MDKPDVIDAENAIPNGQILCYPVIKLLGKKYAHLGSGQNLLDTKKRQSLIKEIASILIKYLLASQVQIPDMVSKIY